MTTSRPDPRSKGERGLRPVLPLAASERGRRGGEVCGAILARARELGFPFAGIASCREPIDPAGRVAAWVAAGRHGEMAWFARTAAARANPEAVLPGAKSIVVVALPYHAGDVELPADGGRYGRIASYAAGRDYHNLIKKRLEKLARFIRDEFDAAARATVDTAPVLERAWAARAGLGFIGKNTCLIVPGAGSFVFLGCVLTTLELEPAPDTRPHAGKDPLHPCGSCRLCIDACPTRALDAPFELDARQCISYLTIEKRGEFAPEESRALGAWIFGCDDCQTACPYNARPLLTAEPDFAPREGRPWFPLDAAAALTAAEFETRFAGSAIRRAKHEGFVRNARAVRTNKPV